MRLSIKVLNKRAFCPALAWFIMAVLVTSIMQAHPAHAQEEVRYRIGAEVRTISEGVEVVATVPGAPAEQELKPGDIVKEITQQPVTTAAQMVDAIQAAGAAGRKTVLLLVERKGALLFAAIDLESYKMPVEADTSAAGERSHQDDPPTAARDLSSESQGADTARARESLSELMARNPLEEARTIGDEARRKVDEARDLISEMESELNTLEEEAGEARRSACLTGMDTTTVYLQALFGMEQGHDYNDLDQQEIRASIESLSRTCGMPRLAEGLFAYVDENYELSQATFAAICSEGSAAGCHFEAVQALLGKHSTTIWPRGEEKLVALCREEFEPSCGLLERAGFPVAEIKGQAPDAPPPRHSDNASRLPINELQCLAVQTIDHVAAIRDAGFVPFASGKAKTLTGKTIPVYFSHRADRLGSAKRTYNVSFFVLFAAHERSGGTYDLCANIVGIDFDPVGLDMESGTPGMRHVAFAGRLGMRWPSIPGINLRDTRTMATFQFVNDDSFDVYADTVSQDLGEGNEDIPNGILYRVAIRAIAESNGPEDVRKAKEFLNLSFLGLNIGIIQADRKGDWAVIAFEPQEGKSGLWMQGTGFSQIE